MNARLNVLLVEVQRELTTVKTGNGMGAGEGVSAIHAGRIMERRVLDRPIGFHADRLVIMIDEVSDDGILGNIVQILHLQPEFGFATMFGGMPAVPKLRVLQPLGTLAATILVIPVDEDIDFAFTDSALQDDVFVKHVQAVEEGI